MSAGRSVVAIREDPDEIHVGMSELVYRTIIAIH